MNSACCSGAIQSHGHNANRTAGPITAIQMGTINTARHYGLRDMGAIAPGYLADMVANIPNWVAMIVNQDELDIRPPGGKPYMIDHVASEERRRAGTRSRAGDLEHRQTRTRQRRLDQRARRAGEDGDHAVRQSGAVVDVDRETATAAGLPSGPARDSSPSSRSSWSRR